MSSDFDPYHEWLGIAPRDQPPNSYRLLGVDIFESNLKVIENAAEQRAMLLRSRQIGEHSVTSQRLLNEVALARAVLLTPEKKLDYDKKLRRSLGEPVQHFAAPMPAHRTEPAVGLAAQRTIPVGIPAANYPPDLSHPEVLIASDHLRLPNIPWIVYPVALAGVASLLVIVWVGFLGGRPADLVQPATVNPATPSANPAPSIPRPSVDAPLVDGLDQTTIGQMRDKYAPSVVQIEVLRGGVRHAGLGAYVDRRGWIATSYDAIEGATQAEIVLSNDMRLPVAGVIASDVQHGLAILQVNGLPVDLTPLAVRSEDPRLGERLFHGSVDTGRAALTDTTVLGVLTTKDLPFAGKASVKSDLHESNDLMWIEHLSALEDRATGGPVLDAKGRIAGVNIVLGGAGEKGYAIHAKHLAKAIGAASGDIKPIDPTIVASGPTPMPSPGPMPEAPVSPADQVQTDSLRLQLLCAKLFAKNWKATTAEDYKEFLEVSERLASVAKIAETDGLLESLKKEAAAARDAALEDLANFVWPADVSGTNKQAVEAMNAGEKFMFVYAEVKLVKEKEEKLDNRDVVVLQPIGTEKLLFLPIRQGFGDMRMGSQWLILARRDGRIAQVQTNDGKMHPAEMIETRHVIGKPAR